MVVVDYKTFVGVTISKLNLNYKIKKNELYFLWIYLWVCVCVWNDKAYVMGIKYPTKMKISEILGLVGTFFGPHEEN